jgi:flagellar FliL protein
MAEDSAKEASKEKLKFFKKTNGSENGSAVAVADAKDDPKEEAATTAEQSPQPEQTPARPDAVSTKTRVELRRTAFMPMVAPALALGVRTLVILAIIIADAYAAYFLVVKGIAPRMAEAQVVRAAREATAVEEPPEVERAPAGGRVAGQAGTITLIEDIVVNPAGSSGTRYLCTTVALESTVPMVDEEVAEREAQIRDVLIEILSRRTVDELSALSTRDELRSEIQTAVNEMLVSGEVVGVYLSNFILQ